MGRTTNQESGSHAKMPKGSRQQKPNKTSRGKEKDYISQEAWNKIEERGRLRRQKDWEAAKELT
eukprot:11174148-Lingulodinium_polyedra.AAC.1